MIGQTILHYQILERLGAGGMGEIYKAQDTRLNRTVAIKVLSKGISADPDSRRRFIQEAQAASSLNHPNIITIHDIVSVESDQFMVMEFVNGSTLGDLIPHGGLAAPTALTYAVQIAEGLKAAHAAGIVHRDLKPGNIMVTPNGLVKILDFGLAKVSATAGTVSLEDVTMSAVVAPMTVQGSIIGTVAYMSPEQAQGAKVDARSDIFSFGCVLYEMVTGSKAFPGDSALLSLTAILRDEPPPILESAPTVPPRLVQAINRALRKDPAQRWASMQDLHAELHALKQRSDSSILFPELQVKAKRPKPWGWIAAVAIGLMALVFVMAWWFSTRRAAKPAVTGQSTVQTANPSSKPSPLAPAILNNDAILKMVESHVSPPVIISLIRASAGHTRFNLSVDGIIQLTKGGVPEEVLQAMRYPAGAPVAASPTVAAQQTRKVQVAGGTSFEINLVEDVSADCKPGQILQFQVRKDITSGDTVVVSKGALVTGEVVEAAKKQFLVHKTRATFQLRDVVAVDGSKLKVRAAAGRLGESRKAPQFEPIGGVRAKDTPVPAGSRFMAYFDGDQEISVRR
jgi:serine/threonine protein kinase